MISCLYFVWRNVCYMAWTLWLKNMNTKRGNSVYHEREDYTVGNCIWVYRIFLVAKLDWDDDLREFLYTLISYPYKVFRHNDIYSIVHFKMYVAFVPSHRVTRWLVSIKQLYETKISKFLLSIIFQVFTNICLSNNFEKTLACTLRKIK